MNASDQRPAHRRFSGEVAWRTIWLHVFALAGWMIVVLLVRAESLGMASGFALCVLLGYLLFTPLHESVHGNVSGGRRGLSWLDACVGWSAGVILFAPYPAFKVLHLRHHSATNDAARDPDHWVAGRSFLGVIARCLTIIPYYYVFLFFRLRREGKTRSYFRQTMGGLVTLVLLASSLTWAGFGREVFWLWLAPGQLAIGLLALVFDWVPHHPHSVRGRWVDTRTIPGRGLEFLMLGQNYHSVHHLWPRVPFYAYRRVFEAEREEFARRKAPMGWRNPPRSD